MRFCNLHHATFRSRGHDFLIDVLHIQHGMAGHGIPYPIKGVMYYTAERFKPGGLFDEQLSGYNSEGFVFQDAMED